MARGDFYASPFGSFYSFYMHRPRLAALVSRLVWGGDLRPYYEDMSLISEVELGRTIVDCPCGAGVAFGRVPPGPGVRYVAVDSSPSMLRRAAKEAERLGVEGVEFVESDAADIPLGAGSADLFLSFWGLHCFFDPQAAVYEAARVLAPGGRLFGCTFVSGAETLRQRFLIRPGFGDFGAVPSEQEVESYLGAAGLVVTRLLRHGPMLYFAAQSWRAGQRRG